MVGTREPELFQNPPNASQHFLTGIIRRTLHRRQNIAVEMCPDIQENDPNRRTKRSAELAAEIERPGTDINLIRRQACEGGSRNKGQIDAHAKTHNDHEETNVQERRIRVRRRQRKRADRK